jgi:DNA helicase-2/ATP-dependent DNA helicase PcrA
LKLKKHSSQLKLVSHSKLTETPISLTRFSNGLVEQYHLGLQVKSLIDKGTDPGEIAVIYKRNQTALELIPILNYFKIPYQIAGGGNVLADDQIRLLVRLLKLIAAVSTQEEDGVASFEFLTLPFFDLNPVDIIRVSREAAKRRRPILDQLGDKQLKALELRDPEQLQKIRDRLFSWSAQANQMPLSEFVQLLVFESGFLGHLEKRPDSFEKLTHLKALLDFVSGLQQSIPDLALPGLVEQLEILDQNGLGIDEPDLGLQPGLVTLTTAHKTKGLEWDHCFLYRLVDGEWGNPRTRELIKLPEGILQFAPRTQDRKQQNEDERRLFYVCLTRAKKQLYLSYSAIYPQGGSRENAPSLFLSELPTSLIEEKKVDTAIEDVMAALKSLVSPTPPRVGQDERKYLKTLINDELQLSASAITTYQQCGYKFKLRYLLKIPEAQSPILIFGSAVHRSLELFFAQLKRTQTVPPLETLLELFVSVIERQPLAESELGHRREKGVQILTAYYQQHQEEFPEPLFVERWFGGRGASILWKNIPLVGKIDRVDLIDARSKSVRVVDYKTGRPKSLNHILGKTAEADQSQLTQLLFYKLITELDPSFNYQVSELVLDFVEGPHQHKNFKRPQISATKEQIEELKQTIESTYRDIKQLKFDRTTNLRTCHDCPFKHHCWPDGLPRIDPEQLSLLEAN